jgi:hypothetical protein
MIRWTGNLDGPGGNLGLLTSSVCIAVSLPLVTTMTRLGLLHAHRC